jgi:hypothetical protein
MVNVVYKRDAIIKLNMLSCDYDCYRGHYMWFGISDIVFQIVRFPDYVS